jgi:Uma2 family endonuclease
MSAVKKPQPISVADYLAGELVSQVKHEYDGGHVYAMSGGRVAHSKIAINITGICYTQLKGKQCRPFNSDMKVHIPAPPRERFYYPDVSVVCRSNADDQLFQDEPVVVFEVLSQSTRRLDQGEKKDGYLQLASLAAYVLVEQETASVVVYRRQGSEFVTENYEGLEAELQLPEIGVTLPLSEVYADVEFKTEPDPEQ